MNGPGLGRKRSVFGEFCERHGVSQLDIAAASGLHRATIAKAFTENNPIMRQVTKDALANTARTLTKKIVYSDDFW